MTLNWDRLQRNEDPRCPNCGRFQQRRICVHTCKNLRSIYGYYACLNCATPVLDEDDARVLYWMYGDTVHERGNADEVVTRQYRIGQRQSLQPDEVWTTG